MRIALCVKDNLFRDAMERMLIAEQAFEVVASAGKASTCISAARVHDARVILCVWDGLDDEDLAKLKTAKEEAPSQVLIVGDDVETVEKAGIPYDRFLGRSANRQKVFRALSDLASKEMRPRLVVRERTAPYSPSASLTPREYEIALKVAEGLANRDIAIDLNLAEQTVKNLVSVIMRKMGCRNRVQVALRLSKSKPKSVGAR